MSFFRKATSNVLIPQSQPLNSRQVANNAGGFSFGVDKWDCLSRFLILGTEGGTYYVGQDKMTERAEALVNECLAEDAARTLSEVVQVSMDGRAVKQDYAIFALALALASNDVEARKLAYNVISSVCRTASTLFQLLSYTKGRRGWSTGFRKAISRWYENRDTEGLAYQMVKYRERNGYTHRDVMRLAHPDDASGVDYGQARHALFQWATNKEQPTDSVQKTFDALPQVVQDYLVASAYGTLPAEVPATVIELVKRLPREALPTEWLKEKAVWEALLFGGEEGKGMPLTALLRNLGNLSKNGVLVDTSRREVNSAVKYVTDVFHDEERIRKSRVHPIAILLAQSVYASGKSLKGSGAWAPSRDVTEALDDAFTLAFANVEPTNQRLGVFVDVSGSMTSYGTTVAGTNLTPSAVSVAMATVIAQNEPNAIVAGFDYDGQSYNRGIYRTSMGIFSQGPIVSEASDPTYVRGVYPIKIGARERLKDVMTRFNQHGGGTDCSLPFKWLMAQNIDVDAVMIFTDSETWAGNAHSQALLEQYRKKVGHRVRMIVASTTATDMTIGDPKDRDVLQVAGFDASVPTVINDFLKR